MSAITIVKENLNVRRSGKFPKELLELLHKKYSILPHVDELLCDPDISPFFEEKKVKQKRKRTIEERRGFYDGTKCDARVWNEKKGSGGLGYDNIQCNRKKVDGCFCRVHGTMYSEGKLWTGKITEQRPKEPIRADGKRMFWSTDENGKDIIKGNKISSEKDHNKNNSMSKDPKEMSIDELLLLIKKKEELETNEQGDQEGEEGGIGAGVGFEEDATYEIEKTISSDSELTEPCDGLTTSSEEEEESYILKTIGGVEYQINLEDKTVIRINGFEIVGEWDSNNSKIIFNK